MLHDPTPRTITELSVPRIVSTRIARAAAFIGAGAAMGASPMTGIKSLLAAQVGTCQSHQAAARASAHGSNQKISSVLTIVWGKAWIGWLWVNTTALW